MTMTHAQLSEQQIAAPVVKHEEWRAIPGYEGCYEASSHGRVRALRRQVASVFTPSGKRYSREWPERIMTLCTNKRTSRVYVYLANEHGRRNLLVHRLIWTAFNGPIPEGLVINHIDSNPANNNLDNLEVVTQSANIRHGYRHGKMSATGSRNGQARLTETNILEIRRLQSCGAATRELAARFGVSRNMIHQIVSRKRWSHV